MVVNSFKKASEKKNSFLLATTFIFIQTYFILFFFILCQIPRSWRRQEEGYKEKFILEKPGQSHFSDHRDSFPSTFPVMCKWLSPFSLRENSLAPTRFSREYMEQLSAGKHPTRRSNLIQRESTQIEALTKNGGEQTCIES